MTADDGAVAERDPVSSTGERGVTTRPRRLEQRYRVRFDEATAQDTVRTGVYLRYMQDCAWGHSEALGFPRSWYAERGIFWLVRAVQLDVLRPLATYAVAAVSTEVLGWRRAAARRLSEARDEDGSLVARAEIDWVLTNERGLPTRVPLGFHEVFGAEPLAFEMHRVRLPGAPPDADELRFPVRRHDLDPMGHVNNAVYIDYLEESLEAAGQLELLSAARRYVVEYSAAAAPGDELVGSTWQREGGWLYRLARQDGRELFRGRVAAL